MKYGKFRHSRWPGGARDLTAQVPDKAEQDCPRGDPPASMGARFQGSITPVNVPQAVSPKRFPLTDRVYAASGAGRVARRRLT
jgi:hypothetical protein